MRIIQNLVIDNTDAFFLFCVNSTLHMGGEEQFTPFILITITHLMNISVFSFQTGVLEMTWVVNDFTATSPQELTVSKGQQVEVVEICSSKPDYCLVRMPTRGPADHESGTVPEGLVPLSALKQPPTLRSSPRRHPPVEHDVGKSFFGFLEIQINNYSFLQHIFATARQWQHCKPLSPCYKNKETLLSIQINQIVT